MHSKMGSINKKNEARLKRKKRIRKKILGTAERPRLTVFRSAKHIYSQIIDDTKGITLASAASSEKEVQAKPDAGNKVAVAALVGKLLGERAIGKGIKMVVFDRNGFMYHGRVKAVSDGAREAGLIF
jgi:large subunit ribosomal protein L18